MMFAKRPKRGEDDEDILRFQEEFLRSSANKPSATVVKVKTADPSNTAGELQKQPVDEGRPADKTAGASILPSNSSQHGEQPMDVAVNVLLDRVMEKSNVSAFLRSFSPPSASSMGFPEVPKLSPELLASSIHRSTPQSTTPKKKKSLFMQQLENKKLKQRGGQAVSVKNAANTSSGFDAAATSTDDKMDDADIKSGTDLSSVIAAISHENEQKVAKMSREEILAEQQELASMFDPNILQMLKNRKCASARPKSQVQFSAVTETQVTPPSVQDSDAHMNEAHETVGRFQKDVVDPIKTDELPFEPDSRWLHMDQLEHEKLRWLRPMDEHKTKKKSGKQEKLSARFDFSGELVNPDVDIDAKSALHHHGDEPQAAGYTLEELYILVRSLNTSQKTLALATIANVIRKAKQGDYLYLVNTSIIKSLLEADLVLLLRYALDEKSDLVLAAAINAWHSLLCHHGDMAAMRALNCSVYGHLVVELFPVDTTPPTTEEEEIEREEEQYIEILRRDVISGLLLMDFLPRLRYILEVVRPQQKVCSQILDILSRMMMTSSEVAYKVYRTPRLVNLVFEEFIPITFTSSPGESECGHGKPLVEAMRTVRYLCASGRHMASELIVRHGLMERIVRYVTSDDASEFGAAYEELLVESLLTWRTITLYGLALEHYHILRASLVTRLQQEESPLISSSIICLLSAFLSAGATEQPEKTVRFSDLPPGGIVESSVSTLDWVRVAGLVDSVYGLTIRHMENLIESYSSKHANYDLAGLVSSLDFMFLYLTHSRTQPIHIESAAKPHVVANDLANLVSRLLKSTSFSKLLTNIRKSSILLNDLGFLTSETLASLPSLQSVAKSANTELSESGCNRPPSGSIQLIVLLQSLIKIMSASLKVNPSKLQQICVQLIEHTELQTYIKQVIKAPPSSNSTNYFSIIECVTLMDICQLGTNIPTSSIREIHRLGLALVSISGSSTLAELHRLFSNVVFSPAMFRSHEEEASKDDQVYMECISSLPSISNTYISLTLPMGEQLQHYKNLNSKNTLKTSSMLVKHVDMDLLPSDWPFMPIMHLYQTSNSRVADVELPPDTCHLVKSSLRFIYLLDKSLPDVTKCVPTHAKVARVMCSFLLDNDLFMEADMQRLLTSLLQSYCHHIDRIQFNQPIPGLHSFSDLYSAFIEHFEATSFGNHVFAQYLLLPTMQHQQEDYRKLIWTGHPLTLRSIFVTPAQLMFPIDKLLYPEETNSTIIMSMSRYLLSGTITQCRNSVMYIVALHHVNRYMFTCDGKDVDVKKRLLKYAQLCTIEALSNHLIFYKEYKSKDSDSTIDSSIVCYSRLPASRSNTLKSI